MEGWVLGAGVPSRHIIRLVRLQVQVLKGVGRCGNGNIVNRVTGNGSCIGAQMKMNNTLNIWGKLYVKC